MYAWREEVRKCIHTFSHFFSPCATSAGERAHQVVSCWHALPASWGAGEFFLSVIFFYFLLFFYCYIKNKQSHLLFGQTSFFIGRHEEASTKNQQYIKGERMTSTETRIKIRTLATSIIFIILFISSFVIIQVVSVPTPRKRAGAVQQEGALCLWEKPCRERHGWGWSLFLFVSRSKQKGRKSTNLNWKKWNLNLCYICDMSALHFGFLDICDKMCNSKNI